MANSMAAKRQRRIRVKQYKKKYRLKTRQNPSNRRIRNKSYNKVTINKTCNKESNIFPNTSQSMSLNHKPTFNYPQTPNPFKSLINKTVWPWYSNSNNRFADFSSFTTRPTASLRTWLECQSTCCDHEDSLERYIMKVVFSIYWALFIFFVNVFGLYWVGLSFGWFAYGR